MAKRKRKTGQAGALDAVVQAQPASRQVTFQDGILDTSQWASGKSTEQTALSVDALYACVRVISDGVAAASWGEWRGLVRLQDSRLTRRPMQRLTRRHWAWLVTSTMALYNVCPLRLVGGTDNEGVPWSLVPLNPALLYRDPGTQVYRYGDEVIPPDELRFVQRATFPSITPQVAAVLSLARQQIEAAASAAMYAGSWWESGGAPLVVLSVAQDLSKDQGEAIADRWLERRAKGPAYPAVLGKGATAEAFGANLGTDQAAAAQDRLMASIARYFGVPPHLVNVPNYASSLQYQNVESADLHLVRYTLNGYSQPIADVLSDLLPGDYLGGRAVRLDLSALTRGEQAARYAAWASAIAAGWLTIDEVRQAEGYPPLGQAEALGPAVDEQAETAAEAFA